MLSSDCKLQKDVAQSYVILANSKKPLATLAREKNSVLSSTFFAAFEPKKSLCKL